MEIEVYRNNDIDLDLIRTKKYKAIIISPGPKSPAEAGISLSIIKEFANKLPILGVCLGHQAIGSAFGGKIVHAPKIVHGKTSKIFHNGEHLFKGLKSPFLATRYHSLVVEEGSVPSELEIVARSDDGVIMALAHQYLPIFGLQFHPESILTEGGLRILENFTEIALGWRLN